MKKLLAIILTILVVGGIGVGVTATISYNKPENVAISAIKGVFEDFNEREEIQPVWNMLHGGSASVSVDKIKHDDYDLLDGGKFSGKIYFSENAIMVDDINVDYNELQLNGSVYFDENMIYVSEDKLFDAAYGIVYKDLAKDLEDSIFAYGSGSEYAIPDKDSYDRIMEMFEALSETNIQDMEGDVKYLLETHIENIWDIVCENAEFESDSESVRLNGKKEKVRVVTITMDAKDVANMLRDIYDYLCRDKTIGDFIDKYAASFVSISIMDSDQSLGELYEEYLEDLEDEVDSLCDYIEDIDELDDFQIRVMTPKMSHKLLKMEVEFDGDVVFSLDFGKEGLKKTDKITLEIDGKELTYTVSENTKKAYEAELEYEGYALLEISIDRSDNSYKLDLGDGYISIKGDYTEDGDATTINVSKFTVNSIYGADGSKTSDTYKTDITIVIDENDKMPNIPSKFDRISDITDKDIERWLDEISKIW